MMKAMWAVAGAVAAAQAPARLTGDWQARAGDEIRHIMVRSDSSAQFGQDAAPRGPADCAAGYPHDSGSAGAESTRVVTTSIL